MAANPFNSVGGYTIGIPPTTVIDSNGNVTAGTITATDITASGDTNITGNITLGGDIVANGSITSSMFYGDFSGNIVGNLVVPGDNTQVLFNNNGNAGASSGFTFDSIAQLATISGDLVANTMTLGSGVYQLCESKALFADTTSTTADQVLYTVNAGTISALDVTIVATDATGGNRQISKLFATVWDGEVGYFEYGTIDVPLLGPGVADFKVVYSLGNVLLTVTPMTANTVTYKIMMTSYKE
jgi:hypothetical protein